ncbi:uncharacterized protein BDR25DRAFT_360585 [Lindgomyces ingoldianus]|uniref:Uncharacterized protein n=1 Tax=Lindgomyces ingoldianus TaxID=673940 RepID=A0ACB6QHQ8_9PLEO|nr:uncharacterized protein BDR25DRAFT_360585 [Lindgomyces ingoldianus]KAF2465652.1 hypothetical protein BDR25DRAFT_360585 [Lindgomyces ingoldianus]
MATAANSVPHGSGVPNIYLASTPLESTKVAANRVPYDSGLDILVNGSAVPSAELSQAIITLALTHTFVPLEKFSCDKIFVVSSRMGLITLAWVVSPHHLSQIASLHRDSKAAAKLVCIRILENKAGIQEGSFVYQITCLGTNWTNGSEAMASLASYPSYTPSIMSREEYRRLNSPKSVRNRNSSCKRKNATHQFFLRSFIANHGRNQYERVNKFHAHVGMANGGGQWWDKNSYLSSHRC